MNTQQLPRVSRAGPEQLSRLLPLYGAYREFYEQAPDPSGETEFLGERVRNGECTVFLAEVEGDAAGFVLLYPTWDSVEMSRVVVLHDLYVDAGFRRHGVGRALMRAAHDHCRSLGASRVDLVTAVTNISAQPLYESMGYEREKAFYTYSLEL